MTQKFVVGLFESKGIAEDACNRLKYEGVPANEISLVVLHDTAPMPGAVSPELDALSVDPLVFGNVREDFAPYIRNGETVVFVLVASEADIEQAVDTIRQYSPIRIQVVAVEEGAPLDRDLP